MIGKLPGFLTTLLCGLLWAQSSYGGLASDSEIVEMPWYEVSLVIFKNRYTQNVTENWGDPEDLTLQFPPGLIDLDAAVDGPKDIAIFKLLPPQDPDFIRALGSIKLSSNYQVLAEKTWRQPAFNSDSALPVLIQAGKEYDGHYELEGSVTLLVSRYLHLKTDLWLSDYVQTVEPVTPWWYESDLSDTGSTDKPLNYGGLNYGQSPGTETITKYESLRTAVLRESRRMRSGELHYLDHPLFGIVVKVTSVEKAKPQDEGTVPDAASR